uniref:hypothetical protein n=2 Tax=Thiolapillus sp. TaxID=2017437 RepID=UPI0025F86CC8
ADFLVKSGLIHRCLQFNQAEISGYWHPSGADMPLSGDLGKNERGQKLISGELDVSELEIDTST